MQVYRWRSIESAGIILSGTPLSYGDRGRQVEFGLVPAASGWAIDKGWSRLGCGLVRPLDHTNEMLALKALGSQHLH
jgi:hypothetical protein